MESAIKPIFPYFAVKSRQEAFPCYLEETVSIEEGTGIVHAAPAFGEVDFYACSREGIDVVCPVDTMGNLHKKSPNIVGVFVKDADKEIIHRLKQRSVSSIMRQSATVIHFAGVPTPPFIYKAVAHGL